MAVDFQVMSVVSTSYSQASSILRNDLKLSDLKP